MKNTKTALIYNHYNNMMYIASPKQVICYGERLGWKKSIFNYQELIQPINKRKIQFLGWL